MSNDIFGGLMKGIGAFMPKDAKIRTCPYCDTLNPEGIKYCQECGSRMNQSTSIKCMGCGAEHPIGIRFCGECGTKL